MLTESAPEVMVLRMRTVRQWLEEYGDSHRHPVNERLHFVCVPAIVLSVIGLLSSVPVPRVAQGLAGLDWAVVIAALALLYYLSLSPALAAGALGCFAVMFVVVHLLGALPWPLWATSLAIFVVAWIGQGVGHAIEGRRPSFFKDLQFLLIGPLWLLAAAYRHLGLRY
ncbi:MAG TPA: Mpo1-like protein [Steroidobacteraceae bacterium]|nr:Mpo1-like protein [Steroidobacteraceae bacterium]